MNTRYNMIIVKGQIKTSDIITCRYNPHTKKTDVTFNNGKTYVMAVKEITAEVTCIL